MLGGPELFIASEPICAKWDSISTLFNAAQTASAGNTQLCLIREQKNYCGNMVIQKTKNFTDDGCKGFLSASQ